MLECHHVTGSWNYLLKVRLPNTRDLERFLGQVVKEVQGVQRTETIIALSSAKETTSPDLRSARRNGVDRRRSGGFCAAPRSLLA